MVDLPAPDGPTMAVVLPPSRVRVSPSRTKSDGRPGYANVTPRKTMSPVAATSGGLNDPVVGGGASMTAKKAVAAIWAFPMAMSGDEMRSIEVMRIMTLISTLRIRE